jgi:hypothetical protein
MRRRRSPGVDAGVVGAMFGGCARGAEIGTGMGAEIGVVESGDAESGDAEIGETGTEGTDVGGADVGGAGIGGDDTA